MQIRGQGSEQYPTVPPLVYGITPQESLADMDQESRKRDSPSLNQTVIRMGEQQGKLVSETEEVATPLTQFTQNIMGTSLVTVKPKMKTIQTKMFTQQMPIQPDFYLPDGKGLRLSEVHQIKTTEKSPEGNSAVLLILDNLRAKYNTKFYFNIQDIYMQWVERPLAQIPLKKKDGYILLSLPSPLQVPQMKLG